ncbi:hypothetical protein TIFTF001_028760 [Ficus carica]|uniref:Rho GDP-dissociation inhibitor 1-like n=1 Tax=Ficus carica TaxID=3494 RepID=A0AA88J1Z4_FICCA|nr:hypothetical protein TIFTF001_028760 [Ficus carica]
MSAGLEAVSAAREVAFKPQKEEEEELKDKKNNINTKCGDKIQLIKNNNEIDHEENSNDSDDDETEEEGGDLTKLESEKDLNPGPLFSLKDQLEKDKDDESLRKWKEQLLGRVDLSAVGESKEPEVKILSLTIQRQGRPDLVLPIPFSNNSKSSLFTLKQGNRYRLKFTFTVANNIVSGLKYTNCVWKSGLRVDNSKTMLGTYSPQAEPYTYETKEETTPTIIFARGTYCFMDDDGKCYLDVTYYFDIAKNWPTPS